jgi:glycerophosphoryl diester phosphodiesterase
MLNMRATFLASVLCLILTLESLSQNTFPHPQAHAHNDYEQDMPLWEALRNGFVSVEADVHLIKNKLLVSHERPGNETGTLQQLYLDPLDSLVNLYSSVYPGYAETFYLMIDSKTEAESTYEAIRVSLIPYPNLRCNTQNCPVKVFISGNRALTTMIQQGYQGIGIDGRPNDLGKGISAEQMPVVSDRFANWSSWNGKSVPQPKDLAQVRELAQRAHAEGKKLRLWAIPDNELAWSALLDAGVDLINTDRLKELNLFLAGRVDK